MVKISLFVVLTVSMIMVKESYCGGDLIIIDPNDHLAVIGKGAELLSDLSTKVLQELKSLSHSLKKDSPNGRVLPKKELVNKKVDKELNNFVNELSGIVNADPNDVKGILAGGVARQPETVTIQEFLKAGQNVAEKAKDVIDKGNDKLDEYLKHNHAKDLKDETC